jgi:7,8-dihydroneopterin aldolase/epimerase/oxygenase
MEPSVLKSSNSLSVKEISAQVSLGCSAEERAVLQEVRVSLDLIFLNKPKACETDLLDDTVCYAKLTDGVLKVCSQQSYQTVEHMAFRIFEELRKTVPQDVKLQVSMHKLHPPLASLKGGVFFTYGDTL